MHTNVPPDNSQNIQTNSSMNSSSMNSSVNMDMNMSVPSIDPGTQKALKHSKFIAIGTVALLSIVGFMVLILGISNSSRANSSNVTVEFVPVDGRAIPEDFVQFIFKPEKTGDKISGVDVVIDVENGTVTGWDKCASLTDQAVQFDDLISEASGTRGHKRCGLLGQTSSLPEAVVVKASIACRNNDPVKITIDKSASAVGGPVTGGTYNLNGTMTVSYDCTGAKTGGTGGTGGRPSSEDFTADFQPETCSTEVGKPCNYNLKIQPNSGLKKVSSFYVKLKYDNAVMNGKDISVSARAAAPFAPMGFLLACTSNADCQNTGPCVGNPGCLAKCDIPVGSTTGQCIYSVLGGPGGGGGGGGGTGGTGTGGTGGGAVPTPTPGSNVGGSSSGATPTPNQAGITPTPSNTRTPSNPPSCKIVNKKITQAAGTMELLYTCSGPTTELPSIIDADITLTALANGLGKLTIEQLDITEAGKSEKQTVAKESASYAVGPNTGGGTGNVELDITARFQCIVKRPSARDKMKVRIGLGHPTLKNKVFADTVLSVDTAGMWKGTAKFDVKPADGYTAYVKGEMHIQHAIADSVPTETFPGSYNPTKGNLSLKNGKNTLDMSKIVLLSGDIPPGGQDGIVNSKDMILVRSLLGKRDKESAALADINGDGVVNANDDSCMKAALSERYDRN